MAKRTRKTIAQEVEAAAVLLQKLTRLRAADQNGYCTCVCCGARKPWDQMHGGHYISRKWTATKLMEENIHACCPRCNGPLAGNMIPYTLFMIDKYGRAFVEELERIKHVTKKYYRDEVLVLQQIYKDEIEKIREEKGL